MNNIGNKKRLILVSVIALIHTIISFFTDRGIFTFPDETSSVYRASVFDYTLCKILTVIVLFGIYYALSSLLYSDRKEHMPYKVLKSALPYLIVILGVAAIKLPQGYLTNDEYSIFADATSLTHSTWFSILTPYYYTVSLMILPIRYAPIIFKLVIEYLVVGYVTLRSKEFFGKKTGSISYLLFLLYPVIAYTTSAHRLPIYFLLYLMIYAKMIFDMLEQKSLMVADTVWMLLLGAVLTQWRTEGIYLAVLIPILMFIAYRKSLLQQGVKKILLYVLMAVVFQYLVSIPQNAFMGADLDDAANDRMKPFYAYTITNMYRNGLDLEKNQEDIAIVDKYLSLDMIAAINEHYGDINYEDVLILYQEGFVGVREDVTVEDFINYSDALKRIFVNNPDVFIRTRIGAFCYAAMPYHIEFNGFGVSSLIHFAITLIKTVSYNLFIPFAIVIALLIYSLLKKRWFDFFVAGGLLCHWFIVFILAPASYFKYYFPLYIMAYFYVILGVMGLLMNRKKES